MILWHLLERKKPTSNGLITKKLTKEKVNNAVKQGYFGAESVPLFAQLYRKISNNSHNEGKKMNKLTRYDS